MFEPLLAADPSFQAEWDAHCRDGETPLTYIVMSDLASHMLDKLRDRQFDDLGAILGVVELWLLQGDAEVCTVTMIGLLETLQTPKFFRSADMSLLKAQFGPVLREAWDGVDDYHGNTRWVDRKKLR